MKKSLTAILITASLASASHAADVYRYRDNMPAAEMMLKLMDLFGVVDRIPDPYGSTYGGNVQTGGNSDQLKFMRYMQMVQGFQNPSSAMPAMPSMGDPMPAMNPLAFSGMQMNPLLGSMGTNPFSAPTGGLNAMNMAGMTNPLSSMQTPFQGGASTPRSATRQAPDPSAQIPGFFSNSDLAKITQNAKREALNKTGQGASSSSNTVSTTTIGLDGTWRNATSEVLMIDKDRFIWEDGKGRDLTGYLKITGTKMSALVPKQKKPLIFHYALQGNRLSIVNPSSRQAFHFLRATR